jgi:hypothetical protein
LKVIVQFFVRFAGGRVSDNNNHKKVLKITGPNFRDTVVKVKNSSHLKSVPNDSSVSTGKENPMLTRIRQMLTQADASKWERHGEPLNPNTKHTKAYDTWETVYCMDLPSGIITFRCSQPAKSEYYGGGYTVFTNGAAKYTIELRPRAWNPRTLIDPYFRSVVDKDKNFQLIASGQIAQEVYNEITEIISSFSTEKQMLNLKILDDLKDNVIERTNESNITNWQKSEPKLGITTYEGLLDGAKVSVSQICENELLSYQLLVSIEQTTRRIADSKLAHAVFEIIDEKDKAAALDALNAVLEKAGF